jgi:bifunctional ADP-heptose synthase (sugar kinase/adenylyltransferase)
MSILVIGESCRDIFTYCSANRLCPDVPVPVLNVEHIVVTPGMAGNVFRNIKTKTDNVDIITNDATADLVTKNRFVHSATNHMFCRVDTSDKIDRIKNIETIDLDKYEIVVISDYNKGFLLEDDIEYICNKHKKVFLDTKKQLGTWANNAFIIKINDHEYLASQKFIEHNCVFSDKIIHTIGGGGCIYQNMQYSIDNPVEVKDSSGAGDSFLSALVVNFLKTQKIEQSILYANTCASECVRHKGVTTI